MADVWRVAEGLKPALLMMALQFSYAVATVLYKLAVNDGMDVRIIVAYRYIFATVFLAPIALFLERNKRPKMTWSILFQAFLCGLFGGALSQNFNLESLALISATFVSAMANLTPSITFLMAASLGLERLNLKTAAGQMKIIGTVVALGGAMTLTFFKGTKLNTGSFHVTLMHHRNGHVASLRAPSPFKAFLGALSSLGSSVTYALWLIIQANMSKSYPCYYSSTALMASVSAIFSSGYAFCLDRDLTQWKLGWNVRLLTVAFAGIVVSGIITVVMTWCVGKKGPLYVAAFNPLLILFVAMAGPFMLEEKLYLGSILGGLLIVCGLYMVLWGKAKEVKSMKQLIPSHSSPPEIILTSPTNDQSQSSPPEIILTSPTNDHKSSPHNNNRDHSIINQQLQVKSSPVDKEEG